VADYAAALALAVRLIDENGRDVTFQRLDATAADAAKPWKGPAAPTVAESLPKKAVFLPHTGANSLGKDFIDESLLKRCEQLALIDGEDDLSVFHQLSDDGKVWRIEWLKELKPADITVLYAIGVKR
jgi:hypothetical protein